MNDERVSVREWTDILARIRLGTVKVAGKNLTGGRIKAVAGRLACYADSDGSRVHPGLSRLAVDLEMDYRTVKGSISVLRRLGLLRLVKAGGRAGNADEYQLTIPADLLERIEVWTPTRHTAEVERVRESNRGKYRRDTAESQGSQAPAEDGMQGPQDPAEQADRAGYAGATGTDLSSFAGATGTDSQGPEAPATYQRPRHNYDRPPDEDLRTDAAAPEALTAEDDFDSDVEVKRPPLLRLIEGALSTSIPEEPRANVTKGIGWCLTCYAAEPRQYVVAADPVKGTACVTHLRSAAG